jgi:hypothetical protein
MGELAGESGEVGELKAGNPHTSPAVADEPDLLVANSETLLRIMMNP